MFVDDTILYGVLYGVATKLTPAHQSVHPSDNPQHSDIFIGRKILIVMPDYKYQ